MVLKTREMRHHQVKYYWWSGNKPLCSQKDHRRSLSWIAPPRRRYLEYRYWNDTGKVQVRQLASDEILKVFGSFSRQGFVPDLVRVEIVYGSTTCIDGDAGTWAEVHPYSEGDMQEECERQGVWWILTKRFLEIVRDPDSQLWMTT